MSNRPNIILIVTDQHRADCIGADERAPAALQTPNLNLLAETGVRFSSAYSEAPTCAPARRCLMSGMAPAANGAVGFEFCEWNPAHTLAGELSGAGYQTEMIGKLHLHPKRKRFGFDHMSLADGLRGDTRGNDYVDWLMNVHGRSERDIAKGHGVSTNSFVGRPTHLPEEQTYGYWAVEKAMEFLQKRDPSAPFFLNLSFFEPHPPLTPPAPYYDRYLHRDLPKPFVADWAREIAPPCKGADPTQAFTPVMSDEEMQCCRAGYYGLVNFIDDQIGRLYEFDRKTFRESLIVFVSDHGEMLGDHGLFAKSWPYESSARIPFLVRFPESWNMPPRVCRSPVGLQDVMPTILDAAGLDVPATCTGKSLLPLARGEAERVRDAIHGEHYGDYKYEWSHQYLTDGRWKYVWFTQTGREQLFDLENDPCELNDLALDSDVEHAIVPWCRRMMQVLKDRPEGFTDGQRLIPGQPQQRMLPGYEPDRIFPFL